MFFNRTPSISTKELEELLAEKVSIIDVRPTHSFQAGHIPGAKNVPLQKIENYTPKGKTYIICQTGVSSKSATKYLGDKAYDVVNGKGGMSTWTGKTRGGKL